jgi:hypothetical protein
MFRIESLLSARLFLRPQVVGNRIYFLSNLSGQVSLYAMDDGGSVPEPLLPPNIALQNPHLIGGKSFSVFPGLDKILVMIDKDGDENYQPMLIPTSGGFPEPAFNNFFDGSRVHLGECDSASNFVYLMADSLKDGIYSTYQGNLESSSMQKLAESPWGFNPGDANKDHTRVAMVEGYSVGDDVLYLWERGSELKLLYGSPIDTRQPGQEVPLTAFFAPSFANQEQGLLFGTALFEDALGLGYIDLKNHQQILPVKFTGTVHQGVGQFEDLIHLTGDRFSYSSISMAVPGYMRELSMPEPCR